MNSALMYCNSRFNKALSQIETRKAIYAAFESLEMEIKKSKLTKSAMAKKMRTSRSALDRLLDPSNVSITLQTLESAALALGKNLKVELF